MGCIYNGVCSSLVDLFLWQQVTHLAALMAHCGISPSRYGSLSKLGLFSNSLWICVIWGKYVSLIWSYIGQEVSLCLTLFHSFSLSILSFSSLINTYYICYSQWTNLQGTCSVSVVHLECSLLCREPLIELTHMHTFTHARTSEHTHTHTYIHRDTFSLIFFSKLGFRAYLCLENIISSPCIHGLALLPYGVYAIPLSQV
jgi:hypothetical protein